MARIGKILMVLTLALPLGAAPLLAQEQEEPQPTPEELAIEGLDTLMRALELMLMQIPQYEMPEINERGDIIIRRKNPPQTDPEGDGGQNGGEEGDSEATET